MNSKLLLAFSLVFLATYVAMLPTVDINYRHFSEESDRRFILACVLATRNAPDTSKKYCWDLWKPTVLSKRQSKAIFYYNTLVRALNDIDTCINIERMMMPQPPECSYLDEMDLVEHCFLHHRLREYEPCQNISYPSIAMPTDARTMFLYSAWQNVTATHNHYSGYNPSIRTPKAVIQRCMHSNAWLSKPKHHCHKIVHPQENVTYSDVDVMYQKLYQEMEFADIKRDCTHYHYEEKETHVGVCGKFFSQEAKKQKWEEH